MSAFPSGPSLARAGLVTAILSAVAAPPTEGQSRSPSTDRVPVLLVPGWLDEADQLEPLRERLIAAGWPRDAVVALTFENPVGSNRSNADEVADAIDELAEDTGASRVDVVAHSMGGLAVRTYLADRSAPGRLERLGDGPPVEVRRVVFLGTPHRGTVIAALAWGDGGREMFPGSDLLDRLNAPGRQIAGVEMLSVRTPVDTRVIPGSSAILPGAKNVEICCPTHPGLLTDEETFRAVERFLVGGAGAVP